MKNLQNGAGILFISCLVVLTIVAILGVWGVFAHDVITKSFQTLGIVALVAVIVIIAGRFIDTASDMAIVSPMVPMFKAIRYMTLTVLIASVSLLALIGVLSIWDVITDTQVLYKALSSIGIVAFSSYLAVAVCLERENHPMWKKRSGEFSVGGFVALGILFWIALFTGLFS